MQEAIDRTQAAVRAGGSGYDEAYGVAVRPDGAAVVVGRFEGTVAFAGASPGATLASAGTSAYPCALARARNGAGRRTPQLPAPAARRPRGTGTHTPQAKGRLPRADGRQLWEGRREG